MTQAQSINHHSSRSSHQWPNLFKATDKFPCQHVLQCFCIQVSWALAACDSNADINSCKKIDLLKTHWFIQRQKLSKHCSCNQILLLPGTFIEKNVGQFWFQSLSVVENSCFVILLFVWWLSLHPCSNVPPSIWFYHRRLWVLIWTFNVKKRKFVPHENEVSNMQGQMFEDVFCL